MKEHSIVNATIVKVAIGKCGVHLKDMLYEMVIGIIVGYVADQYE